MTTPKQRSARQWFGLLLAVIGIPTGLYLFFTIAIPLGQSWAQGGSAPTFDFATQAKILGPLVAGIVGINLFLHKKTPPDND